MATKKILIQVILDDKASRQQKKVEGAIKQTTSAIKKMTAEEEKQFIAQEKLNLQNKLYITELKQKAQAELFAADATARSRAQAGLNNAILLETGRLASDVNFGFTAIANNLSQVVTLFSSFVRTSDGVKGAFKELGKSIMGTGGLLIGIQLIIGLLPRLDALIKDLRSRTLDLSDVFKDAGEGVSDVSGSFESYIRILQDSTASEKNKKNAIEALNQEFPEFVDNLKDADISMNDIKDSTEAATEQIDLQRDAIIKLAKSRAAQSEIDKIAAQQNQDFIDLENELAEEGIKLNDKLLESAEKYLKKREGLEERFSKAALTKARASLARSQEEGVIEAAEFLREQKILDERIDSLLRFLDLENKEKKKNKDEDSEYVKTKIGNVDKEVNAIKTLGRIREKFFKKNQDQDVKDKETALEKSQLQRIQALAEVDAIEGNETAKRQARLEINAFYDKKDIEAAKETQETKDKINKLEEESKLEALDNIGKGLVSASKIAGESTGVGKALAVAGTLVSTYSAAQKAYDSQIVVGDPTSQLRANIARAAAILSGLANVKAIMSVKSPAMKETTSVSGGTGAISVQAPDFNVVGQGGVNQLGQVIGSQFGQPIRAYVVSGDISSAQELDRSITAGATID
jgi:hypothetical protein